MPQFVVTADILHTCSNSMCAVCMCLSVHVDCFDTWSWGVFLEAMKVCEEFIQYLYMQSSQFNSHSHSINLTSLTHSMVHSFPDTLKLTPCGLTKTVK